jgi:hypothetical protein
MRRAVGLTVIVSGVTFCFFAIAVLQRTDVASVLSTSVATALGTTMFLGLVLVITDGMLMVRAEYKRLHRTHQRVRGLCPTCGYDVRANDERCSECGEPLRPDAPPLEAAKTPALRRIIHAAIKQARAAKCAHVGSEHLLLALVSEPDSVAVAALAALDASAEDIRDAIAVVLRTAPIGGSKAGGETCQQVRFESINAKVADGSVVE